MVRLLGYESEEDLFGLDIASDIYMYKEDRDNWLRAIDKEGEIRSAELILRRADGRKMVAMENAHAVLDQTGKVMYYEGTITDITEAYELSKQLSYEASHDALTGLANRHRLLAGHVEGLRRDHPRVPRLRAVVQVLVDHDVDLEVHRPGDVQPVPRPLGA